MELLLNLVWLMLALPAIWLWRRKPVCSQDGWRLDRPRFVLLLSCILVLLFPVVSATDDLHAMRPEMEESSPSKRMVRQLAGDKSSSSLNGIGSFPDHLISRSLFCPDNEACGQVSAPPIFLREQAQLDARSCRAPPFSRISLFVSAAA